MVPKRILCYGDSNTWGAVPGAWDPSSGFIKRYSETVRWTGRLQTLLGPSYTIVEEGLCGRTTNVDYPDRVCSNGKTYLIPCLYSQAPIDLVVLFLGCNDLKKMFQRSALDVVHGLEDVLLVIKNSRYGPEMVQPPQILLVGYPILTHEQGGQTPDTFENAIPRSLQLPSLFADLAKKHNVVYWDASQHVRLSEVDGTHLEEEGHRVVADHLFLKIKDLLK